MKLIITLASNAMHNQNWEARSPLHRRHFLEASKWNLSVTSMRHQYLWFRVSCNFIRLFDLLNVCRWFRFDVEIAMCSDFYAVQETFLKSLLRFFSA